jgi:hypothetical protein
MSPLTARVSLNEPLIAMIGASTTLLLAIPRTMTLTDRTTTPVCLN